MQSAPRSGAIDALRVLGIVAVVVGHVWSNESIDKALYTWHVPLFFFLTGYFWTPGRSVRTEAVKRWATLGRPYLFWLAGIMAVWIAGNYVRNQMTIEMVIHPLYGGMYASRPFSAFWFVTVLFFATIAYRAIEGIPRLVRWVIIGSGVMAGYFAGDLLAEFPLSIGSTWPCLFFLAAGAGFHVLERRLHAPLLIGVVVMAGCAAVIIVGWAKPLDIKRGDYGTPGLSVFVAVGICAALVLIAKCLFHPAPDPVNRVATELAAAGFVVVLFHAVPLMLFGTDTSGGAIDLVVSLVVPWVIGLLALRTRFSGWVTGVDRSRAVPAARAVV
jgi:acyltransferase